MAAETGNLINTGTINVPYDHGVGMVANDGGTALNTGIINVGGKILPMECKQLRNPLL